MAAEKPSESRASKQALSDELHHKFPHSSGGWKAHQKLHRLRPSERPGGGGDGAARRREGRCGGREPGAARHRPGRPPPPGAGRSGSRGGWRVSRPQAAGPSRGAASASPPAPSAQRPAALSPSAAPRRRPEHGERGGGRRGRGGRGRAAAGHGRAGLRGQPASRPSLRPAGAERPERRPGRPQLPRGRWSPRPTQLPGASPGTGPPNGRRSPFAGVRLRVWWRSLGFFRLLGLSARSHTLVAFWRISESTEGSVFLSVKELGVTRWRDMRFPCWEAGWGEKADGVL